MRLFIQFLGLMRAADWARGLRSLFKTNSRGPLRCARTLFRSMTSARRPISRRSVRSQIDHLNETATAKFVRDDRAHRFGEYRSWV